MVGQAAEQIIAGVVLSERLAVTMYGATHRASFGGQRNLRGLVVDPKMLQEGGFRIALTDGKGIAKSVALDHPNIVQTVAVESGGPDVVVVTRGGGRYVTVQDLIASAKARAKSGGKLSPPVAALIGKSVIEALAAAHKAGVIHGAVHPRSVLIDDEGVVRLGDFVVGRALTTAVAQGADSSLWRGLTGYIAPELVVGEDPTPSIDVFATGAMLFTMLSGEVPPGALRVTPAIERLVQRALDTDPTRRYKTAADLLENLTEALEDDRWDLAERGELIREAGLSRSDSNIDDATEDLLASLGSPTGVQLQPIRATDERGDRSPAVSGNRLDALLADLDDSTGLTHVDEAPSKFRRDPISDIIKADPRRKEAIVSSARVPSLDDPDDDETPLPPPSTRDSNLDMTHAAPIGSGRRPSSHGVRAASADEHAALAAIGDLDEGAKRVNTAAAKLEEAAQRAERAAKRAETNNQPPARAMPIADPIADLDVKTPSLKSPVKSAIGALVLLGVLGGAGYFAYTQYQKQEDQNARLNDEKDQKAKEHDEKEKAAREAQADPGAIEITSDRAGIWLRLGRTPVDTALDLEAGQAHDLVLLHDGFEPTEAQVNGASWSGAGKELKGNVAVTLKPSRTKTAVLPLQPTTPELGTTGVAGKGRVHVDSTPSDAEVWLFLGANSAHYTAIAGRDYELAVVRPGFITKHVEFHAEDWRDGGDKNIPIDSAKKKDTLSQAVDLEPDPNAPKQKGK
ncbi:MAG TPA: protein kinase [Kofleriaceae bacterium]